VNKLLRLKSVCPFRGLLNKEDLTICMPAPGHHDGVPIGDSGLQLLVMIGRPCMSADEAKDPHGRRTLLLLLSRVARFDNLCCTQPNR
jgi:hypothetical protein